MMIDRMIIGDKIYMDLGKIDFRKEIFDLIRVWYGKNKKDVNPANLLSMDSDIYTTILEDLRCKIDVIKELREKDVEVSSDYELPLLKILCKTYLILYNLVESSDGYSKEDIVKSLESVVGLWDHIDNGFYVELVESLLKGYLMENE